MLESGDELMVEAEDGEFVRGDSLLAVGVLSMEPF